MNKNRDFGHWTKVSTISRQGQKPAWFSQISKIIGPNKFRSRIGGHF